MCVFTKTPLKRTCNIYILVGFILLQLYLVICQPLDLFTSLSKLRLICRNRVISVYLVQYHGCWCTGSFNSQYISTHDIDYIKYCLILPTCVSQYGGITWNVNMCFYSLSQFSIEGLNWSTSYKMVNKCMQSSIETSLSSITDFLHTVTLIDSFDERKSASLFNYIERVEYYKEFWNLQFHYLIIVWVSYCNRRVISYGYLSIIKIWGPNR